MPRSMQEAEGALGQRNALVSSLPVPLSGRFVVLRDSIAMFVHVPKETLSHRVAAFCFIDNVGGRRIPGLERSVNFPARLREGRSSAEDASQGDPHGRDSDGSDAQGAAPQRCKPRAG
jgi:hypothetical protein